MSQQPSFTTISSRPHAGVLCVAMATHVRSVSVLLDLMDACAVAFDREPGLEVRSYSEHNEAQLRCVLRARDREIVFLKRALDDLKASFKREFREKLTRMFDTGNGVGVREERPVPVPRVILSHKSETKEDEDIGDWTDIIE